MGNGVGQRERACVGSRAMKSPGPPPRKIIERGVRPNALTDAEREAVEAAVAAGKVRRVAVRTEAERIEAMGRKRK